MSGIVHVGIRFLWINLYSIKKGATAPQALLVSAVLLTLSLLALNYTMTTTVAPGYAHFGSQVYVKKENEERVVFYSDLCFSVIKQSLME